jgi:cellulose synthase/poly-beta-1,6-N-acetylglucosamine synthase-like glycosyltransferase
VSIVIPAYNEERCIRQCLVAAVYQSVPAHEIIVVDNKSTDATAEIVRQMQLEYPDANILLAHQDKEQGLIPTRDHGFNIATGDVCGRIDADCSVEPNWVEVVTRTFENPTVMASTGPVLYSDMPLRTLGRKADDKMRQLVLKLARGQYHFLFGSNMALRKSAWGIIKDEVCRDEEDLMHEDIDLSVHLADQHLKIRYVPEMVTGMSARRVEDSPKDYWYYVNRFDRTYTAHNIDDRVLRVPMVIFMSVYYPAKVLRYLHQSRRLQSAS